MEKDVLKELGMTNRSEVLIFLKMLWNEEITQCLKCGGTHKHLHKKAKKSNNDWKCPKYNAIYKTIEILYSLNEN